MTCVGSGRRWVVASTDTPSCMIIPPSSGVCAILWDISGKEGVAGWGDGGCFRSWERDCHGWREHGEEEERNGHEGSDELHVDEFWVLSFGKAVQRDLKSGLWYVPNLNMWIGTEYGSWGCWWKQSSIVVEYGMGVLALQSDYGNLRLLLMKRKESLEEFRGLFMQRFESISRSSESTESLEIQFALESSGWLTVHGWKMLYHIYSLASVKVWGRSRNIKTVNFGILASCSHSGTWEACPQIARISFKLLREAVNYCSFFELNLGLLSTY